MSHYIIQRQPNGQYGIGDEMFPDLVRVLEFYKTHLLDTTTLSSPLPLDHAAQNGVLCPNFIMEVRHMSYRDSRISDSPMIRGNACILLLNKRMMPHDVVADTD